jgi:8-oxo-dGTP pyrophosphatase MutT (NUDIX family)
VRLFLAPVFDASGAAVLEEACAGMIVNAQAESAARREALEELGVTFHALIRTRRPSVVESWHLKRTKVPLPRVLRHHRSGRPWRWRA